MTGPGPDDSDGALEGEGTAVRPTDRSVSEQSAPPVHARDERDEAQQGGGWTLFARDLVTSVLAVLVVGVYLFAVSGVWPPLVAVESGSMVPNMQENDLVFVMDETRFPGPGAMGATGVVTARAATDSEYQKFARPGDVIVYQPDGRANTTPIIHRAMFWVDAGENWYGKADPENVFQAQDCQSLPNCPAPHAGFITKGDANAYYDQVGPTVLSEPVKSRWVLGTAEVRVPGLGWLRLRA